MLATHNPHVLLSRITAAGVEPVSTYYLKQHLLVRHQVRLDDLRADRVLEESLNRGPDALGAPHDVPDEGLLSRDVLLPVVAELVRASSLRLRELGCGGGVGAQVVAEQRGSCWEKLPSSRT